MKQVYLPSYAENTAWAIHIDDDRSFRILNVIDDYNREGLGIDVDLCLPNLRVIHSLLGKQAADNPSIYQTLILSDLTARLDMNGLTFTCLKALNMHNASHEMAMDLQ